MNESGPILQQLDEAFSRGSPESRLKALWYATDILIAGRYTEDQIWIFGQVIGRLAQEIEVAARAKLARQLASSANAPTTIVSKLAFDDSIDVAGPILRESQRLDIKTLVANARSKSQDHLLAISKRKSLSDEVTDVLVTRGNREVVTSVAANKGARLSDFGFLHLIKRSEGDQILSEHLGLRQDIPRRLFQQLIAKASDEVKRKLATERPEMANEILDLVTSVTGSLHSKFGPASQTYFAAKKAVSAQHQYGNLNEKSILDYAQSRKFEEVTVGLSLLCALPVDVVERALTDRDTEMMMVLAKALQFSWPTTMSLLFLGAPDFRISAKNLNDAEAAYARLNAVTSKQILELYQSRRSAAADDSEARRLPQLHTH